MTFQAGLGKRSYVAVILLGFVLIAAVGLFDYLTGTEFTFSFFYLIPIALITWLGSQRLGTLASLISAVTWEITDLIGSDPNASRFAHIWNTFIVFAFFFVVTWLLSALRKSLELERNLARTDDLTGVVNRRYFFELLQMEINRSQRYSHPFTIAYIDIDNFKAVNDRFGHSTGDQLLRYLVSQTQQHLRNTDTVARIGGDEFGLLLPETDQLSAQTALSKLQSAIKEGMLSHQWPVTISIGVLTCNGDRFTTDDLVKTVDNLMYSVKRGSKNGISFSTCADGFFSASPIDDR